MAFPADYHVIITEDAPYNNMGEINDTVRLNSKDELLGFVTLADVLFDDDIEKYFQIYRVAAKKLRGAKEEPVIVNLDNEGVILAEGEAVHDLTVDQSLPWWDNLREQLGVTPNKAYTARTDAARTYVIQFDSTGFLEGMRKLARVIGINLGDYIMDYHNLNEELSV